MAGNDDNQGQADCPHCFDPWAATFEEAKDAQERLDPGGDSPNPVLPIYQFAAAQRINARRPAIEAGSGFDVLACIRDCVTHGLVAPEWLAYAFNRRYDAVLNLRAGSWDDTASFGRPYPKGKQLMRMREDRQLRTSVWLAVVEAKKRNHKTPIDRGLFETIGASLKPPISGSRAEELYYQALKRGNFNPAKI